MLKDGLLELADVSHFLEFGVTEDGLESVLLSCPHKSWAFGLSRAGCPGWTENESHGLQGSGKFSAS